MSVAAQQGDAECRAGGAQLVVKCCQWQVLALSRFQTDCVVGGQAELVGQMQRRPPNLGVGIGIYGDRQRAQSCERVNILFYLK